MWKGVKRWRSGATRTEKSIGKIARGKMRSHIMISWICIISRWELVPMVMPSGSRWRILHKAVSSNRRYVMTNRKRRCVLIWRDLGYVGVIGERSGYNRSRMLPRVSWRSCSKMGGIGWSCLIIWEGCWGRSCTLLWSRGRCVVISSIEKESRTAILSTC